MTVKFSLYCSAVLFIGAKYVMSIVIEKSH